MKRFVFAIFIIFSVICALTSCSLPIGTLENGKPANYTVDIMWLVPRRQLYQIDDKFNRGKADEPELADFQIFVVDKGGVVEVATTDPGVTIEMSGNHGLTNEFHTPIITQFYTFNIVGKHILTVTYANRSAWYSLEVFSPNNGNSLGGDDGIGIIWLD